MLMRLRYIGEETEALIKNKVYYGTFVQFENLRISVNIDSKQYLIILTYKNLEQFLKVWKILSINKGIANARIHSK